MTRSSWLLSAAAFAASTQAAAAPAPSSVRLNQVGILLDGPKRAVVSNGARQPLPWSLIDPSGRMVASGRTTVFGQDPWSGEHVHQVDFSRVRQPGQALALRVGEAPPLVLEDASGQTIINGRLGLRWGLGDRADFYGGYEHSFTGRTWYKDMIRLEFRVFF